MMSKSTAKFHGAAIEASNLVVPLIRTAATMSFAIAPCSLGFLMIAVSEQLIRSIMVGEDPELLVSDLQNQFPRAVIAVNQEDTAGLVTKVLDVIEAADPALQQPLVGRKSDRPAHVSDALQAEASAPIPVGLSRRETARHCGCPQ